MCLFPPDGMYILLGGNTTLRHNLGSTGLFIVLCVWVLQPLDICFSHLGIVSYSNTTVSLPG